MVKILQLDQTILRKDMIFSILKAGILWFYDNILCITVMPEMLCDRENIFFPKGYFSFTDVGSVGQLCLVSPSDVISNLITLSHLENFITAIILFSSTSP